jgi:hypothetical protein
VSPLSTPNYLVNRCPDLVNNVKKKAREIEKKNFGGGDDQGSKGRLIRTNQKQKDNKF